MVKKILLFALFSILTLSACDGSGDSSNEYLDDCDETIENCEDDDEEETGVSVGE